MVAIVGNASVFFDDAASVMRDKVPELARRWAEAGGRRMAVVRDIFGRFRLAIPDEVTDARGDLAVQDFQKALRGLFGAYEASRDAVVVLEEEVWKRFAEGAPLEEHHGVSVLWVERTLTGQSWSASPAYGDRPERRPVRFVFFSLESGTGRSTACAAAAHALAAAGQRVLVVDLDVESPGRVHPLLRKQLWPPRGVVDWFVEDAVGQGDAVLGQLVADLAKPENVPGSIHFVPAHGYTRSNYLEKLGRVQLDLLLADSTVPEPWPHRLERFVAALERHTGADVVLLDVRSGLNDISGAAVTALGAEVLLFTRCAGANWTGLRILFGHWLAKGTMARIRKRLHMVSAFTPSDPASSGLTAFREEAWSLFMEFVYVYGGVMYRGLEGKGEVFFFRADHEGAPHYPWVIYWDEELARRTNVPSPESFTGPTFGPFTERLMSVAEVAKP